MFECLVEISMQGMRAITNKAGFMQLGSHHACLSFRRSEEPNGLLFQSLMVPGPMAGLGLDFSQSRC